MSMWLVRFCCCMPGTGVSGFCILVILVSAAAAAHVFECLGLSGLRLGIVRLGLGWALRFRLRLILGLVLGAFLGGSSCARTVFWYLFGEACCMCLYGIDWSLVDFNGLPAISMHAA